MGEPRWEVHLAKTGIWSWAGPRPPSDVDKTGEHIRNWLAALLQAEHVNLLLGSGLTRAIADQAGVKALDMSLASPKCALADDVEKCVQASAVRCSRQLPNIEDQIRVILELIGGLRILASAAQPGRQGKRLPKSAVTLLAEWEAALDRILRDFAVDILETERRIKTALESGSDKGKMALGVLGSFFLTFANRSPSRDRLHIFTTNYDRLIEYACDMLGLRTLDRFVGQLSPSFRSSRLAIDIHYNPPGIRGEPRYLEGVVRLTKLHGSVDWRQETGPSGQKEIHRYSIPFGAQASEYGMTALRGDSLIIYPNPAKDVETLQFPYAELFRDFAAAICQPNTVLVTYGFGFGDDHINRIIADMLTIPSTHLVIIAHSDTDGRIQRLYERLGKGEQTTLLIGDHFGDIRVLVDNYLPKPTVDPTIWHMVELMNRKTLSGGSGALGGEPNKPGVRT